MTAKAVFSKIGNGIVDAFKKLPFALHCLVHPFDGYYELKNDPKRSSVNTAILLYILLAISAVFRRQLLGYLYTTISEQLNLNVFVVIMTAVLPYFLWVISNWCFTSLMDGDGKLKDIFCATAVGTIPITIVNILAVPLSRMLPLDSSSVFTAVTSFGYVIAYLEIFIGMVVTHQYSVKKGIATTVLSVIGILIIAFLIVLIFFLVQQVFGFGQQLWTEISFRINE